MRDITKGSVLALFAGHRDEESGVAVDDFQVSDDEAVVEDDRYVGLELVFVDRKYFDFSDFHGGSPGSLFFCCYSASTHHVCLRREVSTVVFSEEGDQSFKVFFTRVGVRKNSETSRAASRHSRVKRRNAAQ